MILLDTNIISEMMKPIPDPNVIQWIDRQEVTQLFVSTITIAEISYGLNVLPEGNRKALLEKAFNKALLEAFTTRILAFDESAAHCYGKIMGHRKNLGQPLGVPDGQIAAIAFSHGAAIATRNIRDFKNCDLHLINPFED
jgi:hypothetical protein